MACPYTGPVAAALAAQRLAKRYGRVEALGGVDLEVGEGELVGLLGPNGAGKSTLVKIACGLVRPTEGSAWVNGAKAGSSKARAGLGYLAELFRFPGWMSADELLVLHQRLAGSTGGKDERTRLLELVALADARDRRVEEMSKGMQQRLGIAQALVGSPRVLLLDEPTSALDPSGRRTVRTLLEQLRERGHAVLLNSHLLRELRGSLRRRSSGPRGSCSWTSRRARSTRSAAARYASCSRTSARAASPSCSTRTCSVRSSSSATVW